MGEIYNVGTTCEIPIVQLARELVAMVCLVTPAGGRVGLNDRCGIDKLFGFR